MGMRRDERGQTILEWMVLASVGFGAGSVAWNVLGGLLVVLALAGLFRLVVRSRA